MKFTVSREAILEPLQMISGAVERRQTQAILSNVLLSVKTHQLDLVATDTEIELRARVTLTEPAETGDITVPARKFIDICRMLPDEATLSVHLTKSQMVINTGSGRYALSTLPADEFPTTKDQPGQLEFQIEQQELYRLFDRTAFSMAQQDVRYYLNGLLLLVDSNGLRAVATDGHRLASSISEKTKLDDDVDATQFIVPRKGVVELMRLLDGSSSEKIGVTLSPQHIQVQTSTFTMISKLIDGKYPDYHGVIPKESDKFVTIDSELLKSALNRVAILSNEKVKGIRLLLTNGGLKLTSHNPEQEEAEELLDIPYQGGELEIGFNVVYLIDVLSNVPNGQVKFSFSNPNSSILVEPNEDEDSFYVIMPLRL